MTNSISGEDNDDHNHNNHGYTLRGGDMLIKMCAQADVFANESILGINMKYSLVMKNVFLEIGVNVDVLERGLSS